MEGAVIKLMPWMLLLLVLLPPTTKAAAPSLHVGAMYEYLAPGHASLLKRVRNSGDATAFVRVEVSEVIYDEHHVAREVERGTATADSDGLIASPSRLIVPAQGQLATRLLFLGERSRERYYRVRFIPVLPASSDEFALSAQEAEDYRRQVSAGVNILAGYGVFVIVHPDDTRHDVRTERMAGQVVLRNAGNSTAVLDELRTCGRPGRGEDCSAPQRIHLLPQRQHMLPLDAGQHYRLQLVEGTHRRSLHLMP